MAVRVQKGFPPMSGLAVVTAARRYRALLIVPGVKRITVPSVIGRLPYLGLGSGAPMLFLAGLSLETGEDAPGTERMNL